jgi:uncharacterized membrane protein/gamma-glutamyl-gamma-aminobutyrate hydrolase PuuD
VLFGVPLALLGLIHYVVLGFVFVVALLFTRYKNVIARRIRPSAGTTKQSQTLMESNLNYWLLIQTSGGLLFSLYLVYLQLFVIHAICPYCMLSALVSTLLFVLTQLHYFRERKMLFVYVFGFVYRSVIKPILFLMDPEYVHLLMVRFGELIGKAPPLQVATRYLTTHDQPMLTQHIEGIAFGHPVGLAAGYARTHKIPYLGLCYGMQLAVVSFAREVMGLSKANTSENDSNTPDPIIHFIPGQHDIVNKKLYGGTMRLGKCDAVVKKGSLVAKLYEKYGQDLASRDCIVSERHRHRYEFNDAYAQKTEKAGMHISGRSKVEGLVEFIELPTKDHPFYMATQGHPEYKSRPLAPHPIFLGFIEACKNSVK